MVQRWGLYHVGGRVFMDHDEEGEYVEVKDYHALEAELARVKAESLRVVKVGEPIDIDDLPGWEWIINDLLTNDGKTYINLDDEYCQPVRLEKWDATPTTQQKEAG